MTLRTGKALSLLTVTTPHTQPQFRMHLPSSHLHKACVEAQGMHAPFASCNSQQQHSKCSFCWTIGIISPFTLPGPGITGQGPFLS